MMSRTFFLGVVLVATLIDAFVFSRSFFSNREGRERIDCKTLFRAIAATTIVFVLKILVFLVLGLTAFGLIHLIYVDLVALAPALALLALFSRRKRMTLAVRLVAIVTLFAAFVGAYATFIEPFDTRLETADVFVPSQRVGARPIRIGVLADIQTQGVSEHERAAVRRLAATNPDLVLVAGDVFQGDDESFERALPGIRALFAELKPPGGIFVVPGDVDVPADRVARLGPNVTPLINRMVHVEVGDRRVTLCGIELDWTSSAVQMLLERFEFAGNSDDIRILLAHRPDSIKDLNTFSRVDLTVAGHTHGGQIVVPGFGPPLTLSRVPRSIAAGGLHQLDGNRIYVSRGVGCERAQAPRIRLFCPPEITLLTIRTASPK